MAGHATSGVIVGGTQDNGTLVYRGNRYGWRYITGGDGGYAAIDPTDPRYLYTTSQNLTLYRSSDGGNTINYSITLPDAGRLFCSSINDPVLLDPANPNRMLAGGCDLWVSNNIKATQPTWASIKSGENKITAIAVAKSNPDVIWVSDNSGALYKTTNGRSTTPQWLPVILSAATPWLYVTQIVIDDTNPNLVYLVSGNFRPDNLWKTTDGGATWQDITGSGTGALPNATLLTLAIHPNKPDWLYVGSIIGLFASENGGVTWGTTAEGPANTQVTQLFWLGSDLVAATYGRGIYRVNLDTTRPGFTIGDVTIGEAGGNAQVTVSLTNAAPYPVKVNYTTANRTAIASRDYTRTAGQLTIAAGATSAQLAVPILNDITPELTETFTITLSSPISATIAKAQGVVTIVDDDKPATIRTRLYRDNNADGSRDGTDPWAAGWSVQLYNAQRQLVSTRTSNSAGKVSFPGLTAGAYTVCEGLTSGWYNSQPGFTDPALAQPCYTFTVTAGAIANLTFGNSTIPPVVASTAPTTAPTITFGRGDEGDDSAVFDPATGEWLFTDAIWLNTPDAEESVRNVYLPVTAR